MIAAMTGTQRGMTPEQKTRFRDMLVVRQVTELHHGDCIGADAEAHAIAKELGIRIVIHPPTNESRRAFCDGDVVLPKLEYLTRNRRMVDVALLLIATPFQRAEQVRSGTWATVRYARTTDCELAILEP